MSVNDGEESKKNPEEGEKVTYNSRLVEMRSKLTMILFLGRVTK